MKHQDNAVWHNTGFVKSEIKHCGCTWNFYCSIIQRNEECPTLGATVAQQSVYLWNQKHDYKPHSAFMLTAAPWLTYLLINT